MKIVKRIALGFTALLVSLGLFVAVVVAMAPWLDGPFSRIAGGPFQQDSVSGRPDPATLEPLPNVELEVQLDSRPSVTVAVIVKDNEIYLPATLTPAEKRWPIAIQSNPEVRVRAHDLVYDFHAYQVADEALHNELSRLGAEKYSQSYFIPENTWFFHLVER